MHHLYHEISKNFRVEKDRTINGSRKKGKERSSSTRQTPVKDISLHLVLPNHFCIYKGKKESEKKRSYDSEFLLFFGLDSKTPPISKRSVSLFKST